MSSAGPRLGVKNVTNAKHTSSTQTNYYTSLHITCSTNVRPKDDAQAHSEGGKLNSVLSQMYTHENLQKFLKFVKRPPTRKQISEDLVKDNNNNNARRSLLPGQGTYSGNLKDVDAQYAIELGGSTKGKRVHSHTILKLQHNMQGEYIQVNIPVYRQLLKQYLKQVGSASKNVYVNVQVMRDNRTLEEYLLKRAQGV